MMNKKSNYMIFTFLIAVLLVLSSFGSLGISTKSSVSNQEFTENVSVISVKKTVNHVTINPMDIQLLSDAPFNNSENIVIANALGNESYPTMVMLNHRGLVAYEYEDNSEIRIVLRNSGDYGQTWSGAYLLDIELDEVDLEIKSPSLCVSPKNPNTAYGAFISTFNNSGVNGIIEAPNVGADLGNLPAPSIVDWSVYDFYDFENPDVVAFDDNIDPWVSVMIGSTDYVDPVSGLGPCVDTPMFMFISRDDPDYVTIAWFPSIEDCSNVSIANDFGSDTIYGVCEIQNGSRKDLLFFKGNPEDWVTKDNLENKTLSEPLFNSNFSHPQIFVKNNEIFIAAEQSGWFMGEYMHSSGIIYSSDAGENWEYILPMNYTMFPSNVNYTRFPNIFVNEAQMHFTFTEGNNLYFTNASITDTANWSDPIQLNSVNDSVVEDYRYTDMPSMDYVVWTDNRSGNDDIYGILNVLPEIDLLIIPESVKLITEGFRFIQTKNWIEFTVKNNGSLPIKRDVPIEITYTRAGKEPQKTDYQELITYIPGNGAEITFKRPIFRFTIIEVFQSLLGLLGIESITVNVDPNDSLNDKDLFNNVHTLKVNYGDIFPRFAWLFD